MARAAMTIRAGRTVTQRLVLERLANLPARGWWSGDLHVHMNYGGAYRNTPSHLAFQARAEDLHVVENLIVNKEQRIPDIAHFRGESGGKVHGQRNTTELIPASESTCQNGVPRRRFTALGGRKAFFCSKRLSEKSGK